ncbi:MAG: hypothetical protein F4Z54_09525 [Acidimicrobiaceae bacterium]|nr:hypothetical protein [Acidimicrobiaceae bacterium]
MTVVVVLLAVAVGVLALIVFGLLRTHAEILRALDRAGIGLDEESEASSLPSPDQDRAGGSSPAGRDASDLAGTVPAGGPTKVAVTGVPHHTLLAFLSSGCRTCKPFWQAFAEPGVDLPGNGTRLVIVGQDPAHDSESALTELVPPGVKAVLSSAAWQDYDVPGSPYFALVDGVDGRVVGAGSALGWEQLRELLQEAVDDAALDRGTWGRARPPAGRYGRSPAPPARHSHRKAAGGPGQPRN